MCVWLCVCLKYVMPVIHIKSRIGILLLAYTQSSVSVSVSVSVLTCPLSAIGFYGNKSIIKANAPVYKLPTLQFCIGHLGVPW